MNLLQLSWKNLINKPLSMALSLILFALGTGLISLLILLNTQIAEKFEKNLAGIDMVIGAKGSPLQLILCSMYHIDTPTGNVSIKEVTPFLREGHPLIETAIPLSLGDSHQGYRIVGTTHGLVELYNAESAKGPLWQKTMEVTLGANVAKELNLTIGDEFYSSHGFIIDENLLHDDTDPLKVVSILQPTGAVIDQLILTNTQTVWAVHDHEMGGVEEEEEEQDQEHVEGEEQAHHNHGIEEDKPLLEYPDKEVTSVLVKFKGRNYQALNMPRSINENTDMQAAAPAIEINRLRDNMGVGEYFLQVLALVIVVVSGLSIFISLYSSLKERKYELALMRVMGASPSKLFSLIILEGLLLAFIGFVIGIAFSHIGMEVLANFMKDSYRYSFSGMTFLREELYLFFGALGIGFVAAVLPAVGASNTDISTTLSEG